ncbi:uncharacterized protein LOC133710850 [Rosa rugosa]|uniref:uncharacterized protein LOC133710850 n=1 Tax=Rosa rugosa TaxID=74645 RepID=UPI002B413B9C|nr:uncharacterized protein LOC133710850 [Rosa rugosa]
MGNWVGKERAVHPDPVDEDEGLHGVGSKSLMRIKVRMTKRELKELMAQVDMTNGGDNSEKLGGLILKEFLEGRLCARVVAVAADEDSDPKGRSWDPFAGLTQTSDSPQQSTLQCIKGKSSKSYLHIEQKT